MLKKILALSLLVLVAATVVVGCGRKAEKVVVTITDNEGKVSPREITVEYVNNRMDHMPPSLLSDVPGEEGKKQFIDEIIHKELLVVLGYRLGIADDPQFEQMRQLYTDDKAYQMFVEDMINTPAEPTAEEVARQRTLRETKLTLGQIIVPDETTAWDAYHRIVDGGEDFATVAREVSIAHSAAEGGKMEPKMWIDYHPVVMMQVGDMQPGNITEPIDIGGAYHIYEVIDRVNPKNLPELTPAEQASMEVETRTWKRTVRQEELNEEMKEECKIKYNDAALAILSEKMAERMSEVYPENVSELPSEERMALTKEPIIPEFTEDESKMELLSYTVGGKQKAWTLGDFRQVVEDTPGIEGPKIADAYGLKLFIWRKVRDDLIQYEIGRRKYKDSKELKDYVDQRLEEFIVNMVYEREVKQKIEQPSGQDVRDYFQSHREDYTEPPKVDLRQLEVATEAEANLYRQMLTSGKATFEELVEKYSIEPWSKSRGGLIDNYYQGERRLEYLQPVVFDLPVGELSKPFPAPSGYVIVEVLKKYPERAYEFSELGDAVKNDMLTIRREARLEALFEEIGQTVQIEWNEQNLGLVKDVAEAREEKRTNRLVATS